MSQNQWSDTILSLMTSIGITKIIDVYWRVTDSMKRALGRSLLFFLAIQMLIVAAVGSSLLTLLSGSLIYFYQDTSFPWSDILVISSISASFFLATLFFTYRALFKGNKASSGEFAALVAAEAESYLSTVLEKDSERKKQNEVKEIKDQMGRLEESMILLSEAMQQTLPKEQVSEMDSSKDKVAPLVNHTSHS